MFHTRRRGTSSASISCSTVSTAWISASTSGALASTMCTSRSASTTSSSVERNASTSWCGRRRTKPTVSESTHGLAAGKVQAAHGGIERREQLVLHEHARVREPVQQRRLARVRVADERDVRDVAALARLALRGAGRREADEVALELLHAAQQAPAIDLELGLARTAGADARTLLAQLETAAAQARQPVAQLRELDLHRALLARRVLGEDVEDQRDAIDDVDREQLLEVALLRGRELVVEDHDVDVERLRRSPAAPRPCPCRCRSRDRACGGAAARCARARRRRCRRAARAPRATPRPLRPCRCRRWCRRAARAGARRRGRPRSR